MEDIKLVERTLIDKVAAEYSSDGYVVKREASLEFLPGFRPDLVVQKGEEVIVIEVKAKTSLPTNPSIYEIATAINAKPGWSFELRLLDEPERMEAPSGARPYDIAAIDRRIRDAEVAGAAGLKDAAFLLAWSACEAAIRILVNAAGVEIKRVTWPGHTLGHAAHQGVITGEDDDFLTDMLSYRNAISTGLKRETWAMSGWTPSLPPPGGSARQLRLRTDSATCQTTSPICSVLW